MVAEAARKIEHYYTPGRVRRHIEEWAAVESWAETPRSTVHLFDHPHPSEEDQRPCMPTPGRGKGSNADAYRGADVRADLERAHASLRFHSLEWTVIDYQMRFGPMGRAELARMAGRRRDDVTEAYTSAIEAMARYLGWEDRSET